MAQPAVAPICAARFATSHQVRYCARAGRDGSSSGESSSTAARRGCSTPAKQLLIDTPVAFCLEFEAIFPECYSPALARQRLALHVIAQDRHDCVPQRARVFGRREEPSYARPHNVGHSADVESYRWRAACHRLEKDVGQIVLTAWGDEHVRRRVRERQEPLALQFAKRKIFPAESVKRAATANRHKPDFTVDIRSIERRNQQLKPFTMHVEPLRCEHDNSHLLWDAKDFSRNGLCARPKHLG